MHNKDSERALWHLFKAHEERIIELLDQNLDYHHEIICNNNHRRI